MIHTFDFIGEAGLTIYNILEVVQMYLKKKNFVNLTLTNMTITGVVDKVRILQKSDGLLVILNY